VNSGKQVHWETTVFFLIQELNHIQLVTRGFLVTTALLFTPSSILRTVKSSSSPHHYVLTLT
jgi:hypothetical protein